MCDLLDAVGRARRHSLRQVIMQTMLAKTRYPFRQVRNTLTPVNSSRMVVAIHRATIANRTPATYTMPPANLADNAHFDLP
jgi:hypothetical protein